MQQSDPSFRPNDVIAFALATGVLSVQKQTQYVKQQGNVAAPLPSEVEDRDEETPAVPASPERDEEASAYHYHQSGQVVRPPQGQIPIRPPRLALQEDGTFEGHQYEDAAVGGFGGFAGGHVMDPHQHMKHLQLHHGQYEGAQHEFMLEHHQHQLHHNGGNRHDMHFSRQAPSHTPQKIQHYMQMQQLQRQQQLLLQQHHHQQLQHHQHDPSMQQYGSHPASSFHEFMK